LVLHQQLPENRFRNEIEHRYFGIFRSETVEGLSGLFKSDLWERVILQACWDEEFVRDAAVASEPQSLKSAVLFPGVEVCHSSRMG